MNTTTMNISMADLAAQLAPTVSNSPDQLYQAGGIPISGVYSHDQGNGDIGRLSGSLPSYWSFVNDLQMILHRLDGQNNNDQLYQMLVDQNRRIGVLEAAIGELRVQLDQLISAPRKLDEKYEELLYRMETAEILRTKEEVTT